MDGLVEVGDGAVVVACIGIGDPVVVVGPGVVGLELDGPVVVGDGTVVVAFVSVGIPAVQVDCALVQRGYALCGLAQRVAEAGDGSVPVFRRVAGHAHGEEAQIGHLIRETSLQVETLQFGHGHRTHLALCFRPQFRHVFRRTQHLEVHVQRHGFGHHPVPAPDDDGRFALLPLGAGGGAPFRFGDGPSQRLDFHIVIVLQRSAQARQHSLGHAVLLWFRPVKVGDEDDDLVGRLGQLVVMVDYPARRQQGDDDQTSQRPATPAGI